MRPLLLAAAACLLAVPAAADPGAESAPWPPGLVLAGQPLALPSQPLLHPDRVRAEAAAPAPGPKRAASLHPQGLDRLGLFADGPVLFMVPHDGVGLDLRGGAYLRLLDNLSLRGGYRIFDYDDKESDGSLDGPHGPLFGLRLRF